MNEMTEFKITTDLQTLRNQSIDANFAEVKAWLEKSLAPYRTMAVSADDVPTAKTYRASIRKVKDRIDQSRKEAKAAALEAYSAFESKCKELTGLCDEAANNIDAQVKVFEDAEKREKIAALRAEYDSHITNELEPFCPWERVLNPKWENKGYSIDLAKEEIYEQITRTESDLSAIRDMGGEDTTYLLDVYKRSHDLSTVIRKASELKAIREQEAERKRQQEAEHAAETAKTAPVAEKPVESPQKQETKYADEVVTLEFRVTCKRSELDGLGKYMKAHGIKYGRV